jgi:DNA-binding NarL/FixJ family response regulator
MKKKKINILIVDDHQMIRDGIRVMLEKTESSFQFIIQEAGDAKIAIALVKNYKFDIVLMDFQLPNNVTGADCVAEIISLKPNSKILAISNHDEYLYLKGMIDAGAKGYVLKNISPTELINAIETVLAGKVYYSSEVAMAFIEQRTTKKITPKPTIQLKKRELDILKLIAEEYTNDEIATKLFLAKTTISLYRQNLLAKFESKNTAGLIRKATMLNLI